jgi:hypothetical protein
VNGPTPAEEAIRAVDPWRRADLVRDLMAMAFDIATHPDWPVPDRVVLTIPVHGDDPAGRRYDVLMTAVALGVRVVECGDGCLCAAHTVGPVTLEARTPARKAAA